MDKKKFDEMAETIIEEYCLEWGDRPDIEAFVAYARKGFEVQHGEYVPPAWKHGDPERRKDNWTLLINEYAPKYDFKYKDWNGKELTFFGLVHAEDDLYYGLMDKDGKVTLASCVGSLDKAENGWYEQIPNGGRCDFCNCVFPVSGPVKCDRYRCPQGPNPLDSQCISNPTGSKDA